MRSSVVFGLLATVAPSIAINDWEAYRLKASSKYTKADKAPTQGVRVRGVADYVDIAKAFVESEVPDATFRVVKDHYVGTNGVAHVYLKQTVNGVDVDNAVFNVNVSLRVSRFCGEEEQS